VALITAPQWAALAIFAAWAVREGLNRYWAPESVTQRRLKTYLVTQQGAVHFAMRSFALLVVLTAVFDADLVVVGLGALAVASRLGVLNWGVSFIGRAFTIDLDASGLPEIPGPQEGFRWFDGSSDQFMRGLVRARRPLHWLEPVALLVIAFGGEAARTQLLVVFGLAIAVGVVAGGALGLTALRTVARGHLANREADIIAAVGTYRPELVLYFSAPGSSSIYQLDQWLPFLESSEYRVMILTREAPNLRAINPDVQTPAVFVRRLVDLDLMLPGTASAVAYVNNGMKNAHSLRFNELSHIQLLHGESDKVSSASKMTGAYDYVFVAGQAAIDRYAKSGVSIPAARFEVVGRPQTDVVSTATGSTRPTLLYAPTWEGYHGEEVSDCSIQSIGLPMVQWLLDKRPDVRIIFRPHPMTGSVDPAEGAAVAEVSSLLRKASRENLVNPDMSLTDSFNLSHVLVADVSSVVADFLRSEKPMIVTDVAGLGAAGMYAEYPTTVGSYILHPGIIDIDSIMADAFGPDPLAEQRIETRQYVLGAFAGSATDRFHAVLREVMSTAPLTARS